MTLKTTARKSVALVKLYFIAKNALASARSRIRGDTMTHEYQVSSSEASRADYATNRFENYTRLANLTPASLRGMRVLEVGPGDNLGAAFLFAAYGATVCTADAYYVHREANDDLATASLLLKRRLHQTDDLSAEDVLGGIKTHYRLPLEHAAEILPQSSFDLVVSNAVLEHVYDLDLALASIDALLVPGGLHVHIVDLRDHGVFTPFLHELTFLGVGDTTWRLMNGRLGLPNRRRISAYQETLVRLGHSADFTITSIVGPMYFQEPIDLERLPAYGMEDATQYALRTAPRRVRERLASMSLRDSVVQGFIVVAGKPTAPDLPVAHSSRTWTEASSTMARSIAGSTVAR